MRKNYAVGINIHGKKIQMKWYIMIDYYTKKEVKELIGNDLLLKSITIYDEDNELNYLYLSHNYLEEITIIGGKNITHVRLCFNNSNLNKFDLSMCEKLHTIKCDFDIEKSLILPKHQLNLIEYY